MHICIELIFKKKKGGRETLACAHIAIDYYIISYI